MDPYLPDAELAQALAVYVESLAIEARVAVFGDASSGIPGRLLEAGASLVHVWDPDPERAAAAADGGSGEVHVHEYPPRDSAIRPADLVLVLDLGLFSAPAEVVALARAMAGDGGVALVRGINRESPIAEAVRAFDYYDLFDLVAARFTVVRMVAEVGFDGVALVVLGEGEGADDAPAVNVDTRLADGRRPVAAFVAVASEREIPLDPYSIIEFAPAEPSERGAPAARIRSDLSQAQTQARALERRLHERTARCDELEAELGTASRQLSSLTAEMDSLRAALAAAGALSAARLEDLDRRTAEVDSLRAALAAAGALSAARLEDLDRRTAEVDSLRAALAAAGALSAARLEDLDRRTAEVEELARRFDRSEGRAAALERECAAGDEAHAAELGRFEDALHERAELVRSLEAELARREQIVRDLVSSLAARDAARPGVPPAQPSRPDASIPAALPLPANPSVEPSTPAPETSPAQSTEPGASGSDALPATANLSAGPSPPIPAGAPAEPSIEPGARGEAEHLPEPRALLEENAKLRSKLDALALELARREADAHAAGWTVAELERRLAHRSEPAGGAEEREKALSRALGEIDALRRALAQEHTARVELESGAALARARAEIERLTVLSEEQAALERERSPAQPGQGKAPEVP